MINTIKHAAQEGASKCIKAILVVGTTLFITLNVWANPTSAATKKEIKDIFKQNPDKEIVVKVEDQQSDKTAKFENTKNTIAPDTTAIKNFFLNSGWLNPAETINFNNMRKESVKSPSRPAVELTIFDVRETATSDFNKAIFIISFLDPFQKTELGKSSFKEIDSNAILKSTYSLYCKMHTQNIKTIKLKIERKILNEKNKQLEEEIKKLEEEIKKLEETLKLLEQIENIYNIYLNK